MLEDTALLVAMVMMSLEPWAEDSPLRGRFPRRVVSMSVGTKTQVDIITSV